MQIEGPARYKLTYNDQTFNVVCARGTNKFSGLATSDHPKIYVVSIDGDPIYVGVTKTPMSQRLRLGWQTGRNGYHGYAWRREGNNANLDIWTHIDATDRETLSAETVEAEVVHFYRLHTGQWPRLQTEIHFHCSHETHRQNALKILKHFGIGPAS